jgi:hypothetical protein
VKKRFLVEPETPSVDFPKITISSASHEHAYSEYLAMVGDPGCTIKITQKGTLGDTREFKNQGEVWKQTAIRRKARDRTQIVRVEGLNKIYSEQRKLSSQTQKILFWNRIIAWPALMAMIYWVLFQLQSCS